MFALTVVITIIGAIFGFILVVLPTLEPEQKILSNRILRRLPSVKFYNNALSGIDKLKTLQSPSKDLIQYIHNWIPDMDFGGGREKIGIIKRNERGFAELLQVITSIDASTPDADVIVMQEFVFVNERGVIPQTSQEFWIKKNDNFSRISVDSLGRLYRENRNIYRNKLLSMTRVLGTILLLLDLALVAVYILLHYWGSK